VGELLHGYAYDDSDFGDDDAPDSEESLDKDDPYQGEDLEFFETERENLETGREKT
jgi:hypothetical protein